ncbi:MAG: 5'/3'-nucleotidase SurE [Planctomycetales bacterium]|nr:5'/3'-nucleotidase SurE [Planctomycetales bacterium]
MKFLITNDDGFDAPGIATLVQVLERHGDVLVVAPDRCHSGCGHQVTTTRPLHCEHVAAQRYRIDGTPADCVRVALRHICPDVDYVVAGINDGGNLGIDTFMSGTVAAVREAVFWQKPGLAISQYRTAAGIDWERTAAKADRAIRFCLERTLERHAFWNINLPADETIRGSLQTIECEVDRNPLPTDFESQNGKLVYRGRYHDRIKDPASDVDVCFSGDIAVSMIRV